MKKINLIALICLVSIFFSSCAENKTIDGVTYRPYSFLNEETCKNDSVQYSISGWAVASGVIFAETIIVPIYVFGYNLYEPVGLKKDYKSGKAKGVCK